jgi:hypothetical protein
MDYCRAKIRDKVGMEGSRVHCTRRSSVSQSDNVIEVLKSDGMGIFGSPKLPKLGTGNCRFVFKNVGLD